MLFHTQFFFAALTGWKLEWKSPPRGDAATGWREATRRHGLHTLFALVWIGAIHATGARFPDLAVADHPRPARRHSAVGVGQPRRAPGAGSSGAGLLLTPKRSSRRSC